VITFDDGCLNFLTLAAPILREYGMKAVVSVVGEYTDEYARSGDRNPNYAYLSWDDIRAIADSGIAEIGNHSYAMHSLGARRGCMKMAGEDDNTYREALKSDLSRLQTELAEKSGVRPEVFTYPYGLISGQSLPVIRGLGFAAALTCEEKVNVLTGNPDELYSLGRFNRPAGISTEQFMARVLK
jgi:peptidoglycan/xylan/chitin deacetylase (PgdA/CDA1 family)